MTAHPLLRLYPVDADRPVGSDEPPTLVLDVHGVRYRIRFWPDDCWRQLPEVDGSTVYLAMGGPGFFAVDQT